jgi:hypothetical protein
MRGKVTVLSFAVLVLMTLGPAIEAQDTATQNKFSMSADQNVRRLTGCLQHGEDANQFTFEAEDGSTWDVKSVTLDLASDVGHTVTVTGQASPTKLPSEKTVVSEDEKKAANRYRQMTITEVVRVRDRCQNDLPLQQ